MANRLFSNKSKHIYQSSANYKLSKRELRICKANLSMRFFIALSKESSGVKEKTPQNIRVNVLYL